MKNNKKQYTNVQFQTFSISISLSSSPSVGRWEKRRKLKWQNDDEKKKSRFFLYPKHYTRCVDAVIVL